MVCAACGTENEAGRKFCSECGSPLARTCPSCNAPNPPTAKFCGECGAALTGLAAVPSAPAGVPGETPLAERRLVSVLFADLVGFTTLSERRDPEEVRELLSRYFDTARRLIGRYGGTLEKFIGDAVMAVWGTPVAQEDDAERAVRAALDLVAAVGGLGQELGTSDLRARAGVLTGEAAVTIGAEGQGMVAGDLVNTASRIQAAAEPGTVYVGEPTRRATDASIAYEDVGTFELKGKAEPVHLWRAARVVAGVRGSMRTAGLESPFVGRDREMRTIKELFHESAEEGKARLVSVAGVAGFGKSRLVWEFFKYIDGLAEPIIWHRGRCLAYGEGVTYWALAEMVRTRAGIAEGEDAASALQKLRTALETECPDPTERAWVEPRLAHLLGLEERVAREREDLFAAWRLFYERMAERKPMVLVFEDMHWADGALLDFVEYLLEWSRSHRLFILTLSRPELLDRRPNWGTGRSSTSLYLGPLPQEAMEGLMRGLVPGLPEETIAKILERAEGVPLYAVETVRMLLDRGLLVREGDEYRLAGPVETLEVPETLHALIAARLDGLTPDERRLLQDASVIGKTFTKAALADLSGFAASELDQLLSSLTRKEVLTIQADPNSPERGQYGFLQDLVKLVAYETLSKRERKSRHLAAAATLERTWGQEDVEIVEVLASHYREAYRAAPDAPDAGDIKRMALEALMRAGEHAASLAAGGQALRYFDEAAELADDPVTRAELLERAGTAAVSGGDTDAAIARYEGAIELFEAEGLTHPAARVSARLGQMMWFRGRLSEALDRMERSFQVLSEEEPDEDYATLAAQLGRLEFFAGRTEQAAERIDRALEIAEALWLPEVLSQALNTQGLILYAGHDRRRQGYALIKYALEVALENDIPSAALRAYYNLADLAVQNDRHGEFREYVELGLALARRLGYRQNELMFLSQTYGFFLSGEWDTAIAMSGEIPREKVAEHRLAGAAFLLVRPLIWIHRGNIDQAEDSFSVFPEVASSADVQERTVHAAGTAVIHLARGEFEEALRAARHALELRGMGLAHEAGREATAAAFEAAFRLGDLDTVEGLLDSIDRVPRGKLPQSLQALALRYRARLAAARGDGASVEPRFKEAAGLFREIAAPFHMAVTLLDHGEWLAGSGRFDDAKHLLNEAREIFERLDARPWIERLDRVAPAVTTGAELSPA
ncbi:MAG TPA: adenylate/guanylate cyclase domain-containing protein [Actinomycetota bacterium]|nr:adenylate/guanylate cyclase domain-containing protein [Actinomycetota bacterium]